MPKFIEDIRRTREDAYFLKKERELLHAARRKSAQEAERLRLMEGFGIRDPELVRELADAGFGLETIRLLYLVPLIQVAWADGGVNRKERQQILEVAALRGVVAGSDAHRRLVAWLNEPPSERFFRVCLRGVKAMLHHRPSSEAHAVRHDLVRYSTRIASATGGFLGLGSRVSRQEKTLLARLAEELEIHHPAAARQVADELAPE